MILSNDPSLTAWGWIIAGFDGVIHDAGCIKTTSEHKKRRIRKGDDTVRRLGVICNALLGKMKVHGVEYVLSELPHGSQSASAAMMIGATTGIMQALSQAKGLGVEWYSENDVKKHLFGRKSVTKDAMRERIAELYDVPWTGVKYRDEAIADAIGVYDTARSHSPALQMMERRAG